MGLREQAAADVRAILEDTDSGFGWPISVTGPDGTSADLVGFSADIGHTIDPGTGQAVSARAATVSVPIAALEENGLGVPRGIVEKNTKPWVVVFNDFAGKSHQFKVIEAMPDRTVGIVVLTLEIYRNG